MARTRSFKAIKKRLKHWVLKWVVNENIWRAYHHYRSGNLQKFWFGKPSLPAPSYERDYFQKAGLEASVMRRLDDYRSAAVVKSEVSLPLTHCAGASFIDFAITSNYQYDGIEDRVVRLQLGDQETCIRDLPYGRWYDIRLNLDENIKTLTVKTDAPIAVTMPRGVAFSKKQRVNKDPRHIIILVLDAWTTSVINKPHPFTGEGTSTPNIDRFFVNGFKTTKGVSSGQWTLPAVGSLFTGLHVSRHHMTHPRRWQEFDLQRRTLPEYFQHAGFHTLCGSVVSRVTPAYGHNRGFDRFLYHFAEPHYSYQDYDPALWIQEIIAHMEIHYHDRTFCYFQFPDTHPSWNFAPDTRYFYLGRRGNTSGDLKKFFASGDTKKYDIPSQADQIYLLKLAELDRMFGCIFDYVERHFGDDAMVVVTADHGLRMPYLSEAHKNDEPFLTDVRVNIPLYMRGRGVPACIDDDVCLPNADLPVMLLNMAGIQTDTDDFDGVNILNGATKREAVLSEYVYAGIYEIAIRGDGHALFLKYAFDDVKYKMLSKKPLYTGLYALDTDEYLPEDNLVKKKPDLVEKLSRIAYEHFSKAGLNGDLP